ncbi:hypothetical protein NDU88_003830 [Pleurodeles waltl]|uniref:Uncharacterized protein n=1 Tax=Pleurodeles waltl TaxID=8319 RepID=A0AAV7MVE8_PLEWA|nr:hypothetical protein NDU88_003830 [Pleurodeles waltl]
MRLVCSEKRREKSRNAARHRRSRESKLFLELAQQLPLPENITSHLDKASIMRLAISYARLKGFILTDKKNTNIADGSQARHLIDALEGFLMVVHQTGEMLFLSDNVNKQLGLEQVDMIGQSLFEYIHPCDEEEIREVLHLKHGISSKKACSPCDFFTRMKCSWVSRDRSPNLKPTSWKVLHCRGQSKLLSNTTGDPGRCLVLLCEPICFPSEPEGTQFAGTFLSRHTLDLKFTHSDERVKDLLGYSKSELQGRSMYDYCHALDGELIRKSHHNLLSKGQTSTAQYRMLSKHGGYVWIQTDATVIYSGRTFHTDSIVCMNYVLSEPVETDVIFSLEQTECFFKPWDLPSSKDNSHVDESELLFTKLRENPEELAQLAPTPGDTIIMLDFAMCDWDTTDTPQETSPYEEMLSSGSSDTYGVPKKRASTKAVSPAYPMLQLLPCPRGAEATDKHCYPQGKQELPVDYIQKHYAVPVELQNCFTSQDTKAAEKHCYPLEDQEFPMDNIEKLFALPDELQNYCTSQREFKDSDLEMLAPYIPMEGEDFQLTPICEDHSSSGSILHVFGNPDFDYHSHEKRSVPGYSQLPSGKCLSPLSRNMELNEEVMYVENGKKPPTWHTYQGYVHPFTGWPDDLWPPDPPFGDSSGRLLFENWPPALENKSQDNNFFQPPVTERTENMWESVLKEKVSSAHQRSISLKRKLDLELPEQSQVFEPLLEEAQTAIAPVSTFKKSMQWFSMPNWEPPNVFKACELSGWPNINNLDNKPAPDLRHTLLGSPPCPLPVLNNLDCEVNAPLQGPCRLLQGHELLCVLDQVSTAMQAAMAPAFQGSLSIRQ